MNILSIQLGKTRASDIEKVTISDLLATMQEIAQADMVIVKNRSKVAILKSRNGPIGVMLLAEFRAVVGGA